MRFRVTLALVAAAVACGGCGTPGPGSGGGFFKQYEYEEDMYLSLDGSATVYVNSSIPALNALRGTTFDERPDARVDRDAVRAYFTTPATRVTRRPTSTRRRGRHFVHVRVDVPDVTQLGTARPFAWSSYRFALNGELFVYLQKVGAPEARRQAGGGLTGDDLVAFRIHVPSRVVYHNAGASNLRRGNILVWEQRLGDRLRGAPLELEARMHTESILHRTLLLFGGTALAVASMFAAVIWWVVRRGGRRNVAVTASR
jgi:hypothetical protein